MENYKIFRGVVITQSNICDGVFYQNGFGFRPLAVFPKELHLGKISLQTVSFDPYFGTYRQNLIRVRENAYTAIFNAVQNLKTDLMARSLFR